MFFLSDDERRLLSRKLWPEVRVSGVAEELRGWNWDKAPLSPIYDCKLSVGEVASQLCSSGRDLYLRRALGLGGDRTAGKPSPVDIVRGVITEAKGIIYEYGAGCVPWLADWADMGRSPEENGQVSRVGSVPNGNGNGNGNGNRGADYANIGLIPVSTTAVGHRNERDTINKDANQVIRCSHVEDSHDSNGSGGQVTRKRTALTQGQIETLTLVREFTARRVVSSVEGALSRYPTVGADSLVTEALPVVAGYRLDGRLLSLASNLCLDALKLGEWVPVVLKFGPRREFHRLIATGYALVMESLWECPVNVGCVTYVKIAKGRVTVERDLFVIGDELRQQFIELRDERARLIEEEIDPGPCAECYKGCPDYGR